MTSHSWIIATMGMVGLTYNIIGYIKQSINKRKTNLYVDGKLLGSVPIRRGIFQSNLFSSLLFAIALLSLTDILRETGMGIPTRKEWSKSQPPVLHGQLKNVWDERQRNRILD